MKIPADAWQAYRTELVHFVKRRIRDPRDAEDLVQDVLTRAYSQRASLREIRKFRSWLYQITRNAIIDYSRTHRTPAELPPVLEAPPNDTHAEAELATCLRPLVDQLPERYRQAVVLAEIDGLKQREVAERLGLSLSGAKSRVQRGRKLLEDVLLQCCAIDFDARGRVLDFAPKQPCGTC